MHTPFPHLTDSIGPCARRGRNTIPMGEPDACLQQPDRPMHAEVA